ncbi:MAG: hypothetical protein DWB45_07280 [Xanthomonadales bacterium]|nr:hypothetical protein [Xanthomonadales bacterium]MDL1868835.1 hypothetical protein [Gammaproteobacteria bacterium PRO6]
MRKSLRLNSLASAVSLVLIGGMAALPAHDALASGPSPALVAGQATSGSQTYIIRFSEPGLLHYHGGVAGLAATAPSRAARKLDAKSPQAVAYLGYLEAQRNQHIGDINAALGRTIDVPNAYGVTMSGIATDLTESEAAAIAGLPGVESVRPAGTYHTDTYRGPEFIGADQIWNGTAVPGGTGTRGQGIVVGVIDTGSFAAHPAFADDPSCGVFNSGNHKLLSTADCLTNTPTSCTGTSPEANANNGHGVHVAGTAVGNTLTSTATPPPTIPAPFTSMSGVAPCASLRSYKVCATNTCSGSAIVAAIEQAITDGVDVINFSISGGQNPWSDNDRVFLDAVGADIFVAASAGNTSDSIPDPVGNVNHLGPWMTTVAASTHDNNIAGVGALTLTGGPGTPPPAIQNLVLNPGNGPNLGAAATGLEIRWNAANPIGCTSTGGFPAGYFTGAIALISRGTCSFQEKANNAQAAGATMAIIYNNAAGVLNMNVNGAPLPAYSILQSEGLALVDYINGVNPDRIFADGFDGPAVLPVTTGDFSPATRQGDVLADFSLRGPSNLTTVTKPDVTGPGVSIYAPVDAAAGNYGIMSGTSMSSPHIAGAAALIRAAQPGWTPAEVKSALMLTAFTNGTKEDLTTAWDPDDVGSGRVDLSKAAKAGFVLDETFANFLAANPAASPTPGDPKTLNIASMRNLDCVNSCSWTRTLRNTLGTASNWTVTFNAPPELGLAADVTNFGFDGTLTDTQAITITASPHGTLAGVTFAEVVFHENGGLAPDAHMYVAVSGSGPNTITVVEGFDDITALAGWVQTNHSNPIGVTNWFQGNSTVFPSFDGAPTAYIGANFNNTAGTGTISNWLITPEITFTAGSSFSFYTRTVANPIFPDRLQVRLSTNGGSTDVGSSATDVGDFGTLLLDIAPTYVATDYPSVWTQFTIPSASLPTSGSGRIALRYFVENGGPSGSNSNYIGIDNVAITAQSVAGGPVAPMAAGSQADRGARKR